MKSLTRREIFAWAAAAASASTLSACSDGDNNRQFANQPIPTEDLVNGGKTPLGVTTRAARPVGTAIAPQTLLAGRGSAGRLYWEAENRVWAVDVQTGASRVVLDRKGDAILGVAGAPSGDRVAVLTRSGKARDETLHVLDPTGVVQRDPVSLGSVAGSPEARVDDSPTAAGRLAWSADGRAVAVALAAGGLAEVAESGEARVLVTRRQARRPGAVAWSPKGDALAFADAGGNGPAGDLLVASTMSLPADPVAVTAGNAAARGPIVALAWTADAKEIVFLGAGSSPTAFDGNIYAASTSGGGSRLLVSAGFAAPVASIVAFALSTAGSSLAVVVATPGERGGSDHSLWLKDVGSSAVLRIGMPTGAHVADLWWTTAGLVWRDGGRSDSTPTDSAAASVLYLVDGSADSVELTRSGTPVATSAASPVGSPVASPPASPVGFPVASPAASPIGTPKA